MPSLFKRKPKPKSSPESKPSEYGAMSPDSNRGDTGATGDSFATERSSLIGS